jgi:hypothetical protein
MDSLDDKIFSRIKKFLEENPSYLIKGQFPNDEEPYVVKTDEAIRKICFHGQFRDSVYEYDRDYDYFFNQLIADVNEANESELEEAKKAIADLESKIDSLDIAANAINKRLDKHSQLIQGKCIANIEKAVQDSTPETVKTECLNGRLEKVVIKFSRNGHEYKAWWDTNYGSNNEFYLSVEQISEDTTDFFYHIPTDHQIGIVKVEKDPSWDNDTFVSVAKIAINAFLDGMRSGSALF